MKRNHDDLYEGVFLKKLIPHRPRLQPLLVSLAAFVISLFLILGGRGYLRLRAPDLSQFEAGKVADRDVVADKTVSWIDEDATRAQLAARQRLISAVFTYSGDITGGIRGRYAAFRAVFEEALRSAESAAGFRDSVNRLYPGVFAPETLEAIYRDPDGGRFAEYGAAALDYLLEAGIVSLPARGLEAFHPERAQLWHNYGPRTERETIGYERLITLSRADEALGRYVAENDFPPSFARAAPALLRPFIAENVFFSPGDTERAVAEMTARFQPVTRSVERGKQVIRKGFVITEAEMAELRAIFADAARLDLRGLFGEILVTALLYGLFVYLAGARSLGRMLKPAEVCLLAILTVLYLAGAVFCRSFFAADTFAAALFLPTALVVMIPAILIDSRAAFAVAMTLPLAAFLAGSFSPAGYIFALTSAVTSGYILRSTERRLDMLKAGVAIGAVNCLAAGAALLIYRNGVLSWPMMLVAAALNGLLSAILVLGLLPFLEQALNSVTNFRLVELADLNTPILKRLFSVAPGTYSHSLMVANLAENACQAIGANPLLARVGAYYHDIGKMDNPDYFVENQTLYNKHTEMNPRLSATVIRSHVKLGVEKARSLGLPREVTDIVAEHHGNSVISYFYAQALKREAQVNREDFTYPGNPPHSRESAVVMLADVTEAACRTLKKPTPSRLERFIHELIMAKFDHRQLAESELTFRELEVIKKSFVRVLAGYYHTRIEYPKEAREAMKAPPGTLPETAPGASPAKTEPAGEPAGAEPAKPEPAGAEDT
ncbi:MAG: HDIG domain-containing protein [Spirochaetaceae bacterium]|jgi:putative nucleotidyltransferase with HDIG domain|nr:HDIG domain-containing protein [Spirochaetaceae bacterium]